MKTSQAILRVLSGVTLFALSGFSFRPAFAQNTSVPSTEIQLAQNEWSASPSLVLLGLFIFAGLATGAVSVLRRRETGETEVLRVLARKRFGAGTELVLLAAQGRELLVSIGPRGAGLLTEWESAEPERGERESGERERGERADERAEPQARREPPSDALAGLFALKRELARSSR